MRGRLRRRPCRTIAARSAGEPGGTPRCAPQARGFTLIELLVAASIAALVGAALVGLYAQAAGAARRAGREAERGQIARSCLALVARDLEAAVLTGGKYDTGLAVGEAAGVAAASDIFAGLAPLLGDSMVGALSGSSSGPGSLRIVAASHRPRDGAVGEADLAEVSYYVAEAEEDGSGGGLYRRETAVLQATALEAPPAVEVAPEVRSMQVRAYDGAAWQVAYDSASAGELPRAVEVTLAVALPGEERPTIYRRVVWLPAGQAARDLYAEEGAPPSGN